MEALSSVQRLLAAGRTAEALAQLQDHILKKAPKWRQSALLLRASWSQLEKEVMGGLVGGEEAERRRNRINAGALELLENLESGLATPKELWQELKPQFWNETIAEEMKKQEQNSTHISGSSIHIEGSSDVIVGSGNTVTKKIVNALGRWQFWGILLVLAGLGGFGYFGGQEILGNQEEAYASLSIIQKELARLAEERGADFEQQLPEIENQLASGMKALKKEDYKTATQELEAAAEKAPLASVYKNLAYAYEQEGKIEKAYEMRNKALEIDPDAYAPKPATALIGKRVNLLASENGPKIVAEGSRWMEYVMDGSLRSDNIFKGWMVIEFPEGRKAVIDQIDTYVWAENEGSCEVEILVGNDTPTGDFTSVAYFKPEKAFFPDQPFQSLSFDPVPARYVRIELPKSCRCYELRLWGRLE